MLMIVYVKFERTYQTSESSFIFFIQEATLVYKCLQLSKHLGKVSDASLFIQGYHSVDTFVDPSQSICEGGYSISSTKVGGGTFALFTSEKSPAKSLLSPFGIPGFPLLRLLGT